MNNRLSMANVCVIHHIGTALSAGDEYRPQARTASAMALPLPVFRPNSIFAFAQVGWPACWTRANMDEGILAATVAGQFALLSGAGPRAVLL